jgi:hypothetical protein
MSATVAIAPFKGTPWVTQLRSRHELVKLGEGAVRIMLRVESAEQWDTIAFNVAADTPVLALKRAALAEFGLWAASADEYIVKLRGFEVFDESESVSASSARDGSTYLLAYRYRRPVR